MATREEIYNRVSFAPDAKLPWWDRIRYCAGSIGTNLPWVAFGYYLMFFYTNVLGISPIIAGTIMLGARVWDCITDMIMGWAVDHFNLKWGKYRSWVLISLIPNALLFIGVFTVFPGISDTAKIIWAVITYGNYGAVAATLCYIPMSAQIMNITKNVEERSTLVGIKMIFANVGRIIVSAAILPMAKLFSGISPNAEVPDARVLAPGFFWMAVVLAALVVVLLYGVAAMSKKYELNADGSYREHLRVSKAVKTDPLLEQIKNVLTNRAAVILVSGIFIQYIMDAVKSGMIMYVFGDYFKVSTFIPTLMLVNTGMMVVGAVLLKPTIHVFKDSNRAFCITMALHLVTTLLFYVLCLGLGPENGAVSIRFGLLFFLFGLSGLFMGSHLAYMGVLLPNCVEYGAWKNKKYQPGMIYSFDAVSLTFGGALGAQLLGILLNWSGYVANTAQGADTLKKLLVVAFLIPSVLVGVQLVIQLFFGLTDKQCNEYAVENQARLKAEAEQAK
ncbi:MFS transporter [Treponema primitia]|uniref:MFS transporter n=1 Tax=Treponema primitia TaxID=88058 RepID=UPI003980C9BB